MRPMSRSLITLIIILVSATRSSLTPLCYEPTSGLGPPLSMQSCEETGLVFLRDYPLDVYTLVHYKVDGPTYIQCPLKIERSGCLFTLDFDGPTHFLRLGRDVIANAILVIMVDCLARGKNGDGGEIVDLVGKNKWITYSLKHPDKLAGNNVTSLGDIQLNETYISPTHLNSSLSMSTNDNPSFVVTSR